MFSLQIIFPLTGDNHWNKFVPWDCVRLRVSGRVGTQYSPEQILEAGRRAESEGRIEYAQQFYRHLTQQFHGTGPARFAAEALARLETAPPQSPHSMNGNGADYSLPPQARSAATHAEFDRRISIAPVGIQKVEPIELPAPIVDYRMARQLARASALFGWPVSLIGLGISAVAVVAPSALAKLPLVGALFTSPGTGIGVLATGLAMVIGGQLVRAHLDMALATRNIEALLRLQAEANGAFAPPDEAPRRKKRRRRA